MTKRILSLLVVVCLLLSTVTVVFADNSVFTAGAGELDATAVEVGNEITIPVTVDAWPAEKVAMVQVDVDFDKTALEYVGLTGRMLPAVNGAMLLPGVIVANWRATAATDANAAGSLSAVFLDSNSGVQGFGALSINDATNGTDVLFELTFKVLDKTANTTVDIKEVLISEYSTGSQTQYSLTAGTVTATDCTVKLAEDVAPLDATWATATDAGYYNVDTDVFGLIRFLFDVTVDGEVAQTGIKFLKSNDITAVIDGTNVTGTAKTFYGDVTGITDDDADTTVYAAAYVTVGDQTVWSAPVSCTPDFVKAVIK